MSTRSRIGIKQPDGKILSVYCHSDGYPEKPGVGWTLKKYYTKEAKVKKLISLGDISSLTPIIGKKHDFTDRSSTTYYGRDRGDSGVKPQISKTEKHFISTLGEAYQYLYQDGKWYFTKGTGELKVLESVKTDKKKLDEGMTLIAYPPAVGGLMGMLPKRVDNFKFKGLPGQFNEHGEKILDEYGQPIKEKSVKEDFNPKFKKQAENDYQDLLPLQNGLLRIVQSSKKYSKSSYTLLKKALDGLDDARDHLANDIDGLN